MHCLVTPAIVAFVGMVIGAVSASARIMEMTDAAIAQKDMPGVVNISSWKVIPPENTGDPPRRVKTYASGFIIDPSGIIVTNKHVVDGAIDMTVIFDNGERIAASTLATAEMVDLALVKVDIVRNLPALQWGDSERLRVGDAVLTIGNPLGIGMSVSAGIVSALNRDIQDTPFDSYIQTDADINHGNSGGPLVGQDGRVVGIDTALYNPNANGGFIGIGLAIPSTTAKFVVRRLLDPSHPKPGWLGLTLQDLTPDLAEAMGLREAGGAIVVAMDPGGPASKAELQLGDVLTETDGIKVSDARSFMRTIVQVRVGDLSRLRIWRYGKEQIVTATVAGWPNYMPGGGIISRQAAEDMIQRVPRCCRSVGDIGTS
jgi:serine protease Do